MRLTMALASLRRWADARGHLRTLEVVQHEITHRSDTETGYEDSEGAASSVMREVEAQSARMYVFTRGS